MPPDPVPGPERAESVFAAFVQHEENPDFEALYRAHPRLAAELCALHRGWEMCASASMRRQQVASPTLTSSDLPRECRTAQSAHFA